jgi:hypothetical protein
MEWDAPCYFGLNDDDLKHLAALAGLEHAREVGAGRRSWDLEFGGANTGVPGLGSVAVLGVAGVSVRS